MYEHIPFTLEQKQNASSTARNEFEQIQKAHYDLEAGPIIKATAICKPGSDQHTLVIGFHHIAFDGFSAQILMRDLAAAYCGQELSRLPKSYLDYAVAERAAKFPVETLHYWKSEFDTVPSVLPLFEFAE